MDRKWAASQLEDFIGAIDSLDQLQHIGNLIAGDESQMLKFEAESNETENTVRS